MAIEEAQYVVNALSKKIASTGYPPKEMTSYNVTVYDGREVWLYFTPPSNTYLSGFSQDNLPLVEVAGVMIRKKHGSAITSINDGELLANIPAEDMNNYSSTPYVDQDVIEHDTYYYRFFPYSTTGRFNTQANNQQGVTIEKNWQGLMFGFDQDFTDLNPDTHISYPQGLENSNYTPVIVNPNRGTPTIGGWNYFISNVLKNAPYMVKRNGEVDYALDPNDYSLKADGTPSDAYNTEYQGGAFAWLEGLYTREWYTTGDQMSVEEGNKRHVRYTATIPQGEEEGHIDYIPATGTYVSGVTYYTDATGSTEVDTSQFVEGETDVSSYFISFTTYWEKVSCCWKGTTEVGSAKGVFIPIGVADSSNPQNISIGISATTTYADVDTVDALKDGFLSSGVDAQANIFGGDLFTYIIDLLTMMAKSTSIVGIDGAFSYGVSGGSVVKAGVTDVFPGFYTDTLASDNGDKKVDRVFHSAFIFGAGDWVDIGKNIDISRSVFSTSDARILTEIVLIDGKNEQNIPINNFVLSNTAEVAPYAIENSFNERIASYIKKNPVLTMHYTDNNIQSGLGPKKEIDLIFYGYNIIKRQVTNGVPKAPFHANITFTAPNQYQWEKSGSPSTVTHIINLASNIKIPIIIKYLNNGIMYHANISLKKSRQVTNTGTSWYYEVLYIPDGLQPTEDILVHYSLSLIPAADYTPY